MTDNTRRLLTWIGVGSLGAGLGLLLGWLASRGVDWDQVGGALKDFPPGLVVLALAVVLLSMYLRAVRWWLMWTTARVSPLRLFWIENATLGVNNISPIRAMDEVLTFGILTVRDRLPGGTVIATMMMSRIQDLRLHSRLHQRSRHRAPHSASLHPCHLRHQRLYPRVAPAHAQLEAGGTGSSPSCAGFPESPPSSRCWPTFGLANAGWRRPLP